MLTWGLRNGGEDSAEAPNRGEDMSAQAAFAGVES